LRQRAADDHGGAQHQAGDGAGGDPAGGFAGGTAAAAARVAEAVFQVVGEVGVARAVGFGDGAIVLAALVGIFDLQGDWCAGGVALVGAGQDPHLVGFLALGGKFGLARAAAVQERLDVQLAKGDARRAAIHDAANGRPMAFAPGRDAKQMAESVVTH